VVHACSLNPSYSGGRDQEDRGSKSALANSLRDSILKKPITKKGLAAQGLGLEFKIHYLKQNKNPILPPSQNK
jgi:hypothetical protein